MALCLLGSPCLHAQKPEDSAAKDHFLKGKALVEEGAYEQAIVELEASYKLNPVPIVVYNIALCYDQLHRYGEAVKHYSRFIETSKDSEQEKLLKAEVEKRMEVLKGFIGTLELEVSEEGAEIIIDDTLVGLSPSDPIFIETGEHEVIVRKTGFYEIKKRVKVVSDSVTKKSFDLMKIESLAGPEAEGGETGDDDASGYALPAAEPSTRRKLKPAVLWSMLGVTGALVVGAAVTGGLAIKDNNALGDMDRSDDWKTVADRRDALALTTDVLIGAAAASAVTSLVLIFFTDFKKEKKTGAFLGPSRDGGAWILGYSGRF
jgi:hypothetical protein